MGKRTLVGRAPSTTPQSVPIPETFFRMCASICTGSTKGNNMKLTNRIQRLVTASALAVAFLAPQSYAASTTASTQTPEQRLSDTIRRELVTLPFYGVFDQLSFSLEGRKVTLRGQVTRPVLQSSAVNVVKAIPGVEEVVNQVEVLPLSPYDDRLRLVLYRTIFGQASLGRYTLGAIPSIHILVKNGNVTLEGRVLNEMDKNLAGIFANQVNGVFQVTNNLTVENKS
jgi:hyperosmotically inducible protein